MTQAILPTITMALCASLQSSCAAPCASFSVEQEIDLSTGSGQGLACTLSVDTSGFEVVLDDGGSIRYQHPVGGSLAADGPCLLTFALDSETDFAVFQNDRAVFIAEHTFTAGELELALAVTDDACVGSGGEGAALVPSGTSRLEASVLADDVALRAGDEGDITLDDGRYRVFVLEANADAGSRSGFARYFAYLLEQ